MKNKGVFRYYIILGAAASLYSCNGGNAPAVPVAVHTKMPEDTVANASRDGNHTAGEAIFRQRCATCHGVDGNARNNNAADLSLTRLDSLGIITTIKNGRGAMPMFQGTLQNEEIAQIEMYVKSLRKS